MLTSREGVVGSYSRIVAAAANRTARGGEGVVVSVLLGPVESSKVEDGVLPMVDLFWRS